MLPTICVDGSQGSLKTVKLDLVPYAGFFSSLASLYSSIFLPNSSVFTSRNLQPPASRLASSLQAVATVRTQHIEKAPAWHRRASVTKCTLDTRHAAYLDFLLRCRNLTPLLQSYRHDFLVLSLLQAGASGFVVPLLVRPNAKQMLA